MLCSKPLPANRAPAMPCFMKPTQLHYAFPPMRVRRSRRSSVRRDWHFASASSSLSCFTCLVFPALGLSSRQPRHALGLQHRPGWLRVGGMGLAAATVAVTLAALPLPDGRELFCGSGAPRVPGIRRDARSCARGRSAHRRPDRIVMYAIPSISDRGCWPLESCILMPPSGAAFFLAAFTIYSLLLIGVEERFLTKKGKAMFTSSTAAVFPVCSLVWPPEISPHPAVRAGCQLS